VLSLDSLSIYKEIDISSAKPSLKERGGIKHFGIDEITPQTQFDVMKFIDIYQSTKKYAIEQQKNIIIVGGTGFYLKALLDGISQTPILNQDTEEEVSKYLKNLPKTYEMLLSLDKHYMENIKPQDTYRISKALAIYLQTKLIPSVYFEANKPIPYIDTHQIKLYEIVWDRELLRERIALRTKQMIDNGLIDEIIFLEQKYTRDIPPMKAIGLKETLEYLDGEIDKKTLHEKITFATAQLAKRQRTFNNGQFNNVTKGDLSFLKSEILKYFNDGLDIINS
jgi:tRNA dimethylallyltransferase